MAIFLLVHLLYVIVVLTLESKCVFFFSFLVLEEILNSEPFNLGS